MLAAFATTLCYQLLGYPGGPIWMALIIAFGSALVLGHRIAAYVSLLIGYPCFVWLAHLANGQPLPSARVAGGIAAWLLLLVAAEVALGGCVAVAGFRGQTARPWLSATR